MSACMYLCGCVNTSTYVRCMYVCMYVCMYNGGVMAPFLYSISKSNDNLSVVNGIIKCGN